MNNYPTPIVGESHYQNAIGRTHEGERALICHERSNPFDAKALRVENNVGDTIGYIARSSWIRRAIHDEGRGTAATIKSITGSSGEMRGIILDVTLTDDDVPVRYYSGKPNRDNQGPGRSGEALEASQALATHRLVQILTEKSEVPISCLCGARMRIPLRQIRDDLRIACAACGHSQSLNAAEYIQLEAQYLAKVRALLADAELPPPSNETLAKMLESPPESGHKPTTTEEGFIKRVLRSNR